MNAARCPLRAGSFALLILAAAPLVSCRREPAFSVFSGFTYVGGGPVSVSADSPVDRAAVVSHGEDALALPERVLPGVEYVFHHDAPLDSAELALQIFPEGLRRQGMTIIKAPQSARDLVDQYVGGPLFSITFSDGRREGLIFNQLHPAPGAAAARTGEDYVLLYLR